MSAALQSWESASDYGLDFLMPVENAGLRHLLQDCESEFLSSPGVS